VAEPNNTARDAALAFAIWRVATAHAWGCTRAEIAKEIGASAADVQRIVRLRNWGPKFDFGPRQGRNGDYVATDTYIKTMNTHGHKAVGVAH